jgi:MFS transporter, DHA3 family, tetracycline resistance protein
MIGNWHARTAYTVLSLGSSALFALVFTVNMLYYATVVKLSPLELVLVGTALELSVFLFEVPTGVVADVVSRRLSILIGFALIGCGFLLEGFIPVFWAVIGAQVLWGIGYTFTSGATQAWLSDEIGEAPANQLMLRVQIWQRYVGFIVLPIAFLLSYSNLQVPIVLSGLGFLFLCTFLALTMPETGFRPHPSHQAGLLVGLKTTFLQALRFARDNTSIRLVFIVTIIFGAASESFDRLWQVHILSFGLPRLEWGGLSEAQSLLLWFIGIDMLIQLLSLPFAQWASKIDAGNASSVARALLWVTATLGFCILVFALSNSLILTIIAYIAARISRGLHDPLSQAWLNQNLEPSTRATVLSLNGQANAVGQIAGGPIIGAMGNASLRFALIAGASILGLCLPLYRRAAQAKRSSNLETSAGNR